MSGFQKIDWPLRVETNVDNWTNNIFIGLYCSVYILLNGIEDGVFVVEISKRGHLIYLYILEQKLAINLIYIYLAIRTTNYETPPVHSLHFYLFLQ